MPELANIPETAGRPGGFAPEATIGVVVGIERYRISEELDAEDRWDLPGPASDAVRMVEWLMSAPREVPAGNIFAFVAGLDDSHGAALRARGVKHLRDARQATLTDFFANELEGLAPAESSQLFLLWGGHGILRRTEERHLYCEDVRRNTMRTIWLNDLLVLLRGFSRFRRQFVFVDACANAHEDTALNAPLYAGLASSKRPEAVEQFALLAASAGQLARNLRDAHSGLFSMYLFEALRSSPGWPVFGELEKQILARFDQQFAQDRMFDQRPVSITVSDQTNRSWTFDYGGVPVPVSFQGLAAATGYSVAALQRLVAAGRYCACLADAEKRGHFYKTLAIPESSSRADHDYDRFNLLGHVLNRTLTIEFLRELGICEPEVGAYGNLKSAFQRASLVKDARAVLHDFHLETSQYRKMFSLMSKNADRLSLEQMLDALAGEGLLGSCRLFDFMFRVANSPACPDPDKVRAWVKSTADPEHFANLEASRLQSRSYTVVISIKPKAGKDETPISFSITLLENGRATNKSWSGSLEDCGRDRAAVLRSIETALAEAIEAADGAVLIEILVPISLLRWNFAELGVLHERSRFKKFFGREHPLVIRWRDRHKTRIAAAPWRKSGAFIRSRLNSSAVPRWAPLPDDPDEEYLNSLEQPGVEFLFVGCAPPARDSDPDWVADVVISGVPFAGWMVDSAPDPAVISPLLDHLLLGDFDQLPVRLRDARKARRPGLYTLAVLWDDPERDLPFMWKEPV